MMVGAEWGDLTLEAPPSARKRIFVTILLRKG